MKTGFFLAALVQLAAAQPHRHHNHQHLHEKREVIVTEVDIVTATTPDVVVFVNQFGDPISTSYVHQHEPTATHSAFSWTHHTTWPETTPTSTSTPTPSSESTAAPTTEPVTTAPSSTTPVASTSSSSTSSAASSTSTSSSSSGLGVTYSPYTAAGDCKTESQVTQDLEALDYPTVRIYGTDCNQVSTVGTAAAAKGMKLIAGVFSITDLASEIAIIAAYAAGDWSQITTVVIGNELVNSGAATAAEVVEALSTARALLTAAGYTGDVVTVDTWTAVLDNPTLCLNSDYAAINAHAFFDTDATAATAGSIVKGYVAQVAAVCTGKTVKVTESGWPSQGQTNGLAVPSEADQATAIASIKASFSEDLILFTAYNDMWKSNFDGSFEAEQYWGMLGNAATSG